MDKSSTEYEGQGHWSDYEESEEISVHLPDTDNESNDSEILPRKRKRARRLRSDDSEPSGIADTSSEEWIWKEIDNVPEIKKITGTPGVNPLIMQKLGANPKSLEVFEEVLNMNFWEILSTETNRYAEQEIKKEQCPSKKIYVEWFPVTVKEMKAYFVLCIIMSQIKKIRCKNVLVEKANSTYANICTDHVSQKVLSYITLPTFCR